MNFVVVGCGRFGAQLASNLYKNGHQVTVVDNHSGAFQRLVSLDFRGRTVEGEALSQDTWKRADMEHVDGVAVVTNSDLMNAVIAQLIRSHFPQVKKILARNYDPAMREMMEAFDLQFISSTAWGAERFNELLIDSAFQAVHSAGNGEVEMYEVHIPAEFEGETVASILDGCREIVCAALTRAGRAELPLPETKLKAQDILTVSATLEGMKTLRAKLQRGKEA